MARLTESVCMTMPADVKALLRDRARRERISADLVAERDLMMTVAQVEQRGATIQ